MDIQAKVAEIVAAAGVPVEKEFYYHKIDGHQLHLETRTVGSMPSKTVVTLGSKEFKEGKEGVTEGFARKIAAYVLTEWLPARRAAAQKSKKYDENIKAAESLARELTNNPTLELRRDTIEIGNRAHYIGSHYDLSSKDQLSASEHGLVLKLDGLSAAQVKAVLHQIGWQDI